LRDDAILLTFLLIVALVDFVIFGVITRLLKLFRCGFEGSLILFAKLLARFFVLFVFELNLDVTYDNSLDFFASLPILFGQTGAASALRPYFLGEGGLGVASVELVSVGRRMHHELLGLEVISLGDKVCDDVRMLWQEGLVIDLFPLEFFAELSESHRVGGWMTHSWETEVLKVQVSDKVELAV
jgi:hypothetical protein